MIWLPICLLMIRSVGIFIEIFILDKPLDRFVSFICFVLYGLATYVVWLHR